jgi:hypothetical protein
MKKCPKCGSDKLARIVYGLPAFNKLLEKQLNHQELYLGGCCIPEAEPEYHCFSCGKDVGSLPLLISKHGTEDYRDIVTSVHFSDGGYLSGWDDVTIKKSAGGIVSDYSPTLGIARVPESRVLTDKEWNKLLDRLFCKLYVHEWKKRFDNMLVMDGEQWELEIRLTNRRTRHYSGSNAFPPYWNELLRTFKPYYGEKIK